MKSSSIYGLKQRFLFSHEPPWDLLMGLLLSNLVTHLSLEEQGKLYVEQEVMFVDHVWISDHIPKVPKRWSWRNLLLKLRRKFPRTYIVTHRIQPIQTPSQGVFWDSIP